MFLLRMFASLSDCGKKLKQALSLTKVARLGRLLALLFHLICQSLFHLLTDLGMNFIKLFLNLFTVANLSLVINSVDKTKLYSFEDLIETSTANKI